MGNADRLFFEKEIKARKSMTLTIQDKLFNNYLKKLGKWVQEMEKENPDYELEDAQLIVRPMHFPYVKNASVGAKIIMKKKE